VGAVGSERIIVPVQHSDGIGADERVHRGGLLGVGADGEEALPVGVFGRGAGAVVLQAGGGDLDGFDDGCSGDAGLIHGGGGRDDGDDLDGVAGLDGDGGLGGGEVERQDLVDAEILRGEDAVETFEGKRAFTVEEVRDVGLAE